jgi:hypothetical protein
MDAPRPAHRTPDHWRADVVLDRQVGHALDDPSIVFLFAQASAPGGRFAAIRVDGVWKPSELTEGDLMDRYAPIKDLAEVRALLLAARVSCGTIFG